MVNVLPLADSTTQTTLHFLRQLTEQVARGVCLDQLLDFIFESFREIIPYNRIGYAFVDQERQRVISRWGRSDQAMRINRGYSAPLQRSSLQTVLDTARPRILNDLEAYLAEHPDSDSTRLILEEGIRSSLTCPLLVQGKPVGFLFFSSVEPETYSSVDVALFEEIAGHLAWIVERAELADEVRRANECAAGEVEKRKALEQIRNQVVHQIDGTYDAQVDLSIAELPHLEGYRLAVCDRPATDVGGTYFDVLQLTPERMGILVADCSGHGPKGIMLKSILRTALRLQDWGGASAGQILGDLNMAVQRCFPDGSFATAIFAIFEPHAGTLTWSDAGHPCPILVKRAGYDYDENSEISERALGLADVTSFHAECTPLGPGDKIVLHTKGILEITGSTGLSFGLDLLNKSLAHHAEGSAQEMLDGVASDVEAFLDGEPATEDVFAFALERHPDHVAVFVPPLERAFTWKTTL